MMKKAYICASTACVILLALGATVGTASGIDIWQAASDLPVAIEKVRAHELKRLQKMDEDGDGTVSREEFSSRAKDRDMPLVGAMAVGVPDPMLASPGRPFAAPLVELADRRVIVKRLAGKDGAEIEVDVDLDISEQAIEALKESGIDFLAYAPQADRMMRLRKDVSEEVRDPSRWFDIVDANGDGVLDREEVVGARDRVREDGVNRRFDARDVNKDGVLNEEDVDLRLKKLEGLDSNGNGAVSQKEIAEVMRMLSSATMWHQENGDD